MATQSREMPAHMGAREMCALDVHLSEWTGQKQDITI